MSKTAHELGYTVQVEATGDVTPDMVTYARRKIEAVGKLTSEPILFAKVVLSYAGDRAVQRRALAQVNLDWNGRPIRAHVAAETMREAVDAVQARLRDRLSHGSRTWEDRRDRRTQSLAKERTLGAFDVSRPQGATRPTDEREVIRHESFELGAMTVEEAAFDLEMLDYTFLLFHEAATDQVSVLYRTLGGFGLLQLRTESDHTPGKLEGLTVSPVAAPVLSLQEAIGRLDMTGQQFVFYADAGTHRAAVVYRRFDGNLGLIEVPAS
jgi:ribosome-associated translation inhibitor RaiA